MWPRNKAVSATLQVFNNSIQTFLPTPSKSHYLFNLRDFSRVILGCLQLKSNLLESSDKFIRIWVHESYRVFADRLVDISDQERFFEIVKDATSDNFKCSLEKVLSHLSQERVIECEHNLFAHWIYDVFREIELFINIWLVSLMTRDQRVPETWNQTTCGRYFSVILQILTAIWEIMMR